MPSNLKKKAAKKAVKKKFIFWCYANLPEDYIFIYGTSQLQVQKKYNSLGGDEGIENIEAHEICEIPGHVQKEMKITRVCDLASEELVLKSGIEFLHKDGSAFRYNGRIYREKGMFDNRYKRKELHVYLFKMKEHLRFKIGHSTNVSQRLKQLSKPFQLEIEMTIPTLNAKQIEAEILSCFKKFQIYNEYLELDQWTYFILMDMFKLYFTEYSRTGTGHVVSSMFTETLPVLKEAIDGHVINTEPSPERSWKYQKAHFAIEKRSREVEKQAMKRIYDLQSRKVS
jgi:hypothetical protein